VPSTLCIVGRKAVGKTTLIERLIPELRAAGRSVATVKRPPHDYDFDVPGKDSYRHFAAGADVVILYGHGRAAAVRRIGDDMPLEEIVAALAPDADIVLVEGHKSAALPKIEVFRAGMHPRPLYAGQREFLAVATDADLDVDISVLDLNDPAASAAFVLEHVPHRR
jgi:molybdopterin-guanine dinucleotide biosynthesis protein B